MTCTSRCGAAACCRNCPTLPEPGNLSTGAEMKWIAWWRARVSATLMRWSPVSPFVNAKIDGLCVVGVAPGVEDHVALVALEPVHGGADQPASLTRGLRHALLDQALDQLDLLAEQRQHAEAEPGIALVLEQPAELVDEQLALRSALTLLLPSGGTSLELVDEQRRAEASVVLARRA